MAIIVSDSFNRADGSLGTADTGQAWAVSSGTWGIVSNTAEDITSVNGFAVLETGTTESITTVTLLNPSQSRSGGVICRWVSSNYFFSLTVDVFPGNIYQLRLKRIYAGSQSTVFDKNISNPTNKSVGIGTCGSLFDVYLDGALQGTYNDATSPQNYGTMSGMRGYANGARFEDFLVTTNGTCTPTYNCSAGACVDPGDGTGTYATLAACLEGCTVAASYNCTDGQCVDPGDGTGAYPTLQACVDSGCGGGTVVVETMKFDAGTGSGYYYVAPIVDSGDELRSKTIKAVRATGKFTNAASEIYGYDVSDVISTTDLEEGLNSTTGQLAITDTSGVAQTPREQVNVPNAVLHTVRILGDDTDQTERDRIDEIVTEQSEIGVRR